MYWTPSCSAIFTVNYLLAGHSSLSDTGAIVRSWVSWQIGYYSEPCGFKSVRNFFHSANYASPTTPSRSVLCRISEGQAYTQMDCFCYAATRDSPNSSFDSRHNPSLCHRVYQSRYRREHWHNMVFYHTYYRHECVHADIMFQEKLTNPGRCANWQLHAFLRDFIAIGLVYSQNQNMLLLWSA